MNWLTAIFSDAAAKVTGSIMEGLDNLFTSDEQRMKMELLLQKEMNDLQRDVMTATQNEMEELSKRHLADMNSDSWLSKNIRPLALATLTVFLLLLATGTLWLLPVEMKPILEIWVDLFTALTLAVYTFYFGSRGLEKIVSKIGDKFGSK